MTPSRLIRQIHRWTSLVFALIVAGLFVALPFAEPPQWTYVLPLPPLFLLLLTGLWMFAQPYLARRPRLVPQE